MTTLRLTFPHPDRAISPNGSVPLKARAAMVQNLKKVALKKATREAAFLEARLALMTQQQHSFVPTVVECDWVYKGLKPDLDNVVARLKPIIDGCCIAFGCNDRDLELGRVRRIHSLGKDAGTLTLTFTSTTQC